MTRSAYLIFNPVAGQGNAAQDLEKIKSILGAAINLEVHITTKECRVDDLSRQAVKKGAEAIIASGGDGTVSAAAAGLIGSSIPLGIIPRGTANAFANALELPTTLEAACQTILEGSTRLVDVAYCNGQPMTLLTGIGFEAEVIERADRDAKNRFGLLAYILAGFEFLNEFQSFKAEIETEHKIVTVSAAAITVANAAPPTSILAQGPAKVVFDDGLLDVTIVAPANRTGAIAASYDLLRTAIQEVATERNDVGYLQAKHIKITTDPPQKVIVDGESIGETPIEIECLPNGLMIFSPQVPEEQPVERLEGLPDLVITLKENLSE